MIVVLSGGVGGARLCAGLMQVFSPAEMLVVVNTGDDFHHWGLKICPDLDTVMYTLAGVVNEEMGWGRAGETWSAMQAMAKLGAEAWFRLGDQDLATHLYRTDRLSVGQTLSEVTTSLFQSFGVFHPVVPATDEAHQTLVETDEGVLAFQDYFVRRRCEPAFKGVLFSGGHLRPQASGALRQAMTRDDIDAVLICPSNPVLSVQPILQVAGVREWLAARRFPVLAVSPFIQGRAVKGPAAAIFHSLGLKPSTTGLDTWYQGLVDGWLTDEDKLQRPALGVMVKPHHTLLGTSEQRIEVAKALKGWISEYCA